MVEQVCRQCIISHTHVGSDLKTVTVIIIETRISQIHRHNRTCIVFVNQPGHRIICSTRRIIGPNTSPNYIRGSIIGVIISGSTISSPIGQANSWAVGAISSCVYTGSIAIVIV